MTEDETREHLSRLRDLVVMIHSTENKQTRFNLREAALAMIDDLIPKKGT